MSKHDCGFYLIPALIRTALAAAILILVRVPARCGPVHEAAKQGDVVKVRHLIEQDPNVALSVDEHGLTALHWAAYTDHKEVVEALLEAKAEVDKRIQMTGLIFNLRDQRMSSELLDLTHFSGGTALLIAVDRHHTAIVKLLLSQGASVDSISDKGLSPLDLAVIRGHRDVEDLLRSSASQERMVSPADLRDIALSRTEAVACLQLIRIIHPDKQLTEISVTDQHIQLKWTETTQVEVQDRREFVPPHAYRVYSHMVDKDVPKHVEKRFRDVVLVVANPKQITMYNNSGGVELAISVNGRDSAFYPMLDTNQDPSRILASLAVLCPNLRAIGDRLASSALQQHMDR